MATIKMFRSISNRSAAVELGFGKNVTTEGRMMNADGSFNVVRQHINADDNIYYHLIRMPWRHFFVLIFSAYIVLNLVFAAAYYAIGIQYLQSVAPHDFTHDFLEAYFFSTQTLTTVGYGRVNPTGLPANILAALESFTGLLAFALISGILYGRFSRPLAKIVFSENLLVAPFENGQALMFRMGNARKSEMLETEVEMVIALNQPDEDGSLIRRFFPLPLERNKISFFSISWTIVHPINENSPLYGFTEQDLIASKAEFLILVKGTDETSQQLLHSRRSYVAEEMIWNARFRPIIGRTQQAIPLVLIRQIGTFDRL